MFAQEQLVVYPSQGVGKIESLEEQEVGGLSTKFYVIRILSSNITVLVPVDNAENVGLRSLSSEKEANQVMDSFKDRSDFTGYTGQNWNRRYRDYTERLKSTCLEEVAGVLKELILISGEKELSFGERRLLEQAMDLVLSELALVYDKETEEVRDEIEIIFEDVLQSEENLA